MERIWRYTLIILTILAYGAKAQVIEETDICACCSYNSLQYKQDYDDLFPPELMKAKKIKQVLVSTTAMNRQEPKQANTIYVKKPITPEYKEIKFNFNEKGIVLSKLWYNRMGKPHSIVRFTYDVKGNKTKETFCYVDSLEKDFLPLAYEITDFTYNSTGRLITRKERNYKGEIMPDNKACYTKYEYDNAGKLILETRQFYYEGSPVSINKTTTKYSENSLTAVSKMYSDDKLISTYNKTYDNKWKLLSEKNLEYKFIKNYEYDSSNRLVKYESKAPVGTADECPEAGNFVDQYYYNTEGLLEKIVHSYGKYSCEMRFEYK